VEVPAHLAEHPLICPHCECEFITSTKVDAEQNARESPRSHDLDANRIRKLAILRRAADRAASYLMIGLVACIVCAAELIYDAWWRWDNRGVGMRGIVLVAAYLLFGIVLLRAALMFYRLARSARERAARSMLTEPGTEPDFSTLQDGSQRVRDLENL
jgi:hypothetical protein